MSHRPVYPVVIVERGRSNPYCKFDVVKSRAGFTAITRVPNAEKYTKGQMFDSVGRVFLYDGSAGWPRFSPKICSILEGLVFVSLLTKLLEIFVYFGPRISDSDRLGVESYRERLLSAVAVFKSKNLQQLRMSVGGKSSYLEIIEALDHWRYFGGERDADGHPRFLKDGSENPDHAP